VETSGFRSDHGSGIRGSDWYEGGPDCSGSPIHEERWARSHCDACVTFAANGSESCQARQFSPIHSAVLSWASARPVGVRRADHSPTVSSGDKSVAEPPRRWGTRGFEACP
jgi:hypothetical protein